MPFVRIAFTGTEDYRADLQAQALARRIKVQELIERALEVYLAQPEPQNAHWHALLNDVLASGDQTAISLVEQSLKAAKTIAFPEKP